MPLKDNNLSVSIIVTAYNRRRFLLDALRSIVRQTIGDYEVIVVKNFYDKLIDSFIENHNFKNVFIDTKYYGAQVAAGVEEAKGRIFLFLEDDDEFEPDKLYLVKETFKKFKDVVFVHNSRRYIDEYGNIINPYNPKYSHIIEFLETITPHKDIVIDPNNIDTIRYLLRYYGIIATVSLMSVKAECIESKLKDLKHIHISVEVFIPAVASECGLLYHTSRRLTRYRIHESSSIAFNETNKLRTLYNLRRAIEDHRYIINNVIRENNKIKYVIQLFQLQARRELMVSYLEMFG